MRASLLTLAACAVCALAVACSPASENTTTNTTTTTTNSANGSTTTTTTTNTSATPAASNTNTAGGTSAAVTGVAECDEYISKVEACVKDKVPAAMRAQMQSTLDANRKAWAQAASTAEGKATLKKPCADALAAAKQAMGSFGCNF